MLTMNFPIAGYLFVIFSWYLYPYEDTTIVMLGDRPVSFNLLNTFLPGIPDKTICLNLI